MKRILTLVLAGAMATMLAACGKEAPKKPETTTQNTTTQTEQQPASSTNEAQ